MKSQINFFCETIFSIEIMLVSAFAFLSFVSRRPVTFIHVTLLLLHITFCKSLYWTLWKYFFLPSSNIFCTFSFICRLLRILSNFFYVCGWERVTNVCCSTGYLPSSDTKAVVYDKYTEICKQSDPPRMTVGETTFHNIWSSCVQHI